MAARWIETNITHELQRFHDAGLGGVQITSIYGVKGAEARDIPISRPLAGDDGLHGGRGEGSAWAWICRSVPAGVLAGRPSAMKMRTPVSW
jgi:hypothetical protein